MSSSEDELLLSAEAQKALKEFYDEQNEKILSNCDNKKDVTSIKFDEDWVSYKIIYAMLFFEF